MPGYDAGLSKHSAFQCIYHVYMYQIVFQKYKSILLDPNLSFTNDGEHDWIEAGKQVGNRGGKQGEEDYGEQSEGLDGGEEGEPHSLCQDLSY